ncbi:MAG: hypothetical protein Q4Q51_03760 [Eubacteriales bacterium]|nr:hypothetical protein [Eubacteriales bacterium]
MIKITNAEVFGWDAAIRGMRNPMNSWDKSDSKHWRETIVGHEVEYRVVGMNDLALMKKLVKAGSDHAKFMRMINVTMDVTAPLYWWKEFDTYKVGTVANSCSTMHTIANKEFKLYDFSHEHLMQGGLECLKNLCKDLNTCREQYLAKHDKEWWWQMIQLLPSSYNQKRTVQLNYAVLRNMYHARRNHKLDEWRDFCSWMESLPYAELITLGGNDNGKD